MNRIGFVGAGRVASALALRFFELGYEISAVVSQSMESARILSAQVSATGDISSCELLFVAVPDDRLVSVLASLEIPKSVSVVHTSGVYSLDVFHALGYNSVGSFHPAYPFREGTRLTGSENILLGIESNNRDLRVVLFGLASALGASPFEISEGKKALYHAAAVMASNYLVTLFDVSYRMYLDSGVPSDLAKAAVHGLMSGALANLHVLTPSEALTGPISRGDVQTIQRHFSGLGIDYTKIYKVLGESTLGLASNLDSETRHQLFDLLSN